jgi:ABC-type multidrug transport system fused ATPase/permease subunit
MPGQVVVVVGINGSGKSTLMKLLGRLFDPISGDIYVDDQPLPSFDVAQLRDSMAFLSQSSEVYPVSLRENIALGISSQKHIEQSDIEDAARLGGSYDLIQNLPQQFDTVLEPVSMTLPSMGACPGGASADLEAMMKQIIPERTLVSGELL